MAKELCLQVKTFDNVTGDTAAECNEFLDYIKTMVSTVTPLYNTQLGGIVYVVQYYTEK